MADLPRYPLPPAALPSGIDVAASTPPNPLSQIGPGITAGVTLGFQSRQTQALEQERQTQLMAAQYAAKAAQEKQLIDYMGVAHETYKDLADVNPEHAFQFYRSSIAPLHQAFLQSHGIQADFSNVNPQDETPPIVEKMNELMDKAAQDPSKIPSVVVTLQQMANMPSTGKMMKEKLEGSIKALGPTTEYQKHQDELEQQAKQQQMSIRGDAVIKQLETQRNAAGQVYDIMRRSQDKNGNYNLTRPQLLDQYANVYRAQSGMGITGEALPMMDQPTAEGNYSKLAAYFGLAKNALPKELGDRLLLMSRQLGEFAETQHAKMMESHLTLNTGLAPERAAKLSKEDIRGFTFQEMADKADRESKFQPQGQNFPANWSAEKIKRYQQWKTNAK